jgi:hypothetical protein
LGDRPVHVVYLSLTRKSDTISRTASEDIPDILNSPLKDISSRSELVYLSEDEINMQWRDVLSQAQERPELLKLVLSNGADSGAECFLHFLK